MSEENKDLNDMADDAMDNANKKAENLGDKANDSFGNGKEETKDFGNKAEESFDNAKEKSSKFADDPTEEDVKKTFPPNNPDNGKMVAIIAHITFIGWIIAIIMNSNNKTELGSYYIRQLLGIYLVFFALSFIPLVGCFTWIFAVVLIVMSVINAAAEKMVPTPVVGAYFQDWFKSL